MSTYKINHSCGEFTVTGSRKVFDKWIDVSKECCESLDVKFSIDEFVVDGKSIKLMCISEEDVVIEVDADKDWVYDNIDEISDHI